MLQPLPWVFALLQYLGNILLLIDSLSRDLQDMGKIMSYGAARAPCRHPKWPPRWPQSWILLKIQIYQENSEIANIFC